MKPRVSILNLLSLMTVVALVLVVIRLRSELQEERRERIQLLKKGGILQVSDPESVHVVQVSSPDEDFTQRWRVYVPKGQRVKLNARVELRTADDPPAPRLPPNAIVVPERATPHPLDLCPGEHVVSITYNPYSPSHWRSQVLRVDVTGDGQRQSRELQIAGNLMWLKFGRTYGTLDITEAEHPKVVAAELRNGHTVAVADGKTFVLGRYRDQLATLPTVAAAPDAPTPARPREAMELLVWLHPNEG